MTKPTIKEGSTGDAVREWQKIVGVDVDGAFGPKTKAATKEWQAKHKLVADGIVGPLTWNAALGASVTVQPQKTASAPTDQWAYNLSKQVAPGLTEPERQYVLSVGRHEGFYGKATTPAVWIGSNNWGAIQGTGPAGSFSTTDHHADGTPYQGGFKKYNTPEQGFEDLVKWVLKPNVRAVLNKNGSIRAAAHAQHDNRYFEADPDKYTDALIRNYNQIVVNTGIKRILSDKGSFLMKLVLGTSVAIGVLTTGLGYWFFRKYM